MQSPLKAQPWVVDAASFSETPSINDFRDNLLVETYSISRFLNNSTKVHDTKFIVVAPKGYGKTLILQAKRASLAASFPSMLLLPDEPLLDRLPASTLEPALVDEKKSTDLRYWKRIWLMSICLSALLANDRFNGSQLAKSLSQIPGTFVSLLREKPYKHTVADTFNAILHLSSAEFAELETETTTHLIPAYRQIRQPIAFFLDNIDEYFDPLQRTRTDSEMGGIGAVYRTRNRHGWVLAQVGLAETIRELHSLNRYVRVFASLRKEALTRAEEFSMVGLQLKGMCLDLNYGKEELKAIFCKNIELRRVCKQVIARA